MDEPAALHLEQYGEGRPAVFVHGTFSWGVDGFPQQVALADTARIILVDRVGFGETPGEPPFGWHQDAPALVATLRSVGPARLVAQRCGARIVEFDRSTHSPQLTEPDRFNALLREVWRDG